MFSLCVIIITNNCFSFGVYFCRVHFNTLVVTIRQCVVFLFGYYYIVHLFHTQGRQAILLEFYCSSLTLSLLNTCPAVLILIRIFCIFGGDYIFFNDTKLKCINFFSFWVKMEIKYGDWRIQVGNWFPN